MVSKPVAGAIALAVIAGAAGAVVWATSGTGLSEGAPAPSTPASASATGTGAADPGRAAGSSTGGGTSSGESETIPAGSSPEAVVALCQVRPIAITSLLAGSKGDGRFEALRDAIPALGERLQNVEDAATGQPAVKPVLVQVKGVYHDWTTALTAYDAGRTSSSQTAMKSAQTRLGSLNGVVKKALPASATC